MNEELDLLGLGSQEDEDEDSGGQGSSAGHSKPAIDPDALSKLDELLAGTVPDVPSKKKKKSSSSSEDSDSLSDTGNDGHRKRRGSRGSRSSRSPKRRKGGGRSSQSPTKPGSPSSSKTSDNNKEKTEWTEEDKRNMEMVLYDAYGTYDQNNASTSSAAAHPKLPPLNPVPRKSRGLKSRWGTQYDKDLVPGMPTSLPPDMTDDQQKAYLTQMKIEELTRKLRSEDLGIHPDPARRSPSPEPLYDQRGKRVNTRARRTKHKLERERHEAVATMKKLNPAYQPPAGYRAPKIKLEEKVFVPVDENPEVDFIRLILGPRATTIKKLEDETGARIYLRGQGSARNGRQHSAITEDGELPGADLPLHVYISAFDEATMQKGVDKVNELIRNIVSDPDDGNKLRKLQLRETALLSGSLRAEDILAVNRCQNCGAEDHKSYECAESSVNHTGATRCTRCNGIGHIAKDCIAKMADLSSLSSSVAIDSEYSALMSELGQTPSAAIRSNRSIGAPLPNVGPAPSLSSKFAYINERNRVGAMRQESGAQRHSKAPSSQQPSDQQQQQQQQQQQPAKPQQQQAPSFRWPPLPPGMLPPPIPGLD